MERNILIWLISFCVRSIQVFSVQIELITYVINGLVSNLKIAHSVESKITV